MLRLTVQLQHKIKSDVMLMCNMPSNVRNKITRVMREGGGCISLWLNHLNEFFWVIIYWYKVFINFFDD